MNYFHIYEKNTHILLSPRSSKETGAFFTYPAAKCRYKGKDKPQEEKLI